MEEKFSLPRLNLNEMTQNDVRSMIPQMIKESTGRNTIGWAKVENKPSWWPEDIPWENVKTDKRTMEQKKELSWNEALKKIVRLCYESHGREDLLDGLVKEVLISAKDTADVDMSNDEDSIDEEIQFNIKTSISIIDNEIEKENIAISTKSKKGRQAKKTNFNFMKTKDTDVATKKSEKPENKKSLNTKMNAIDGDIEKPIESTEAEKANQSKNIKKKDTSSDIETSTEKTEADNANPSDEIKNSTDEDTKIPNKKRNLKKKNETDVATEHLEKPVNKKILKSKKNGIDGVVEKLNEKKEAEETNLLENSMESEPEINISNKRKEVDSTKHSRKPKKDSDDDAKIPNKKRNVEQLQLLPWHQVGDFKEGRPIKIGIIGGSGLDDPDILDDREEKEVVTEFGKPSDALIIGKIKGIDCVLLARHGRAHHLTPSNVNYRANIMALVNEGCTHLLVSQACGSLQQEYVPGEIAFVDQYIDRTTNREKSFYDGVTQGFKRVCHMPMGKPFCEETRQILISCAQDLELDYHDKATMVVVEGPQFSTSAESKLFKSWGGDLINMTLVPEVILAKEAGLSYASTALITDYDSWKETDHASVEKIMAVMKKNADIFKKLIIQAIPKIAAKNWNDIITQNQKSTVSSIM